MKKFLLFAMIAALCLLLCSCGNIGYTYTQSNRYTAGEAEISKRVKELDIGWVDGSVTVEYHNGSNVELTETGSGRASNTKLHWYLEGKTLHVRYAASGTNLNTVKNKHLTVKLPRDLELDQLKISSASAEVAADGIVAERIDINSASGRVALRQAGEADEIKVNIASGDVAVKVEQADRLNINSASGKVIVDAAQVDEVSVDTVSGDVTMQLASAPDQVKCNSVSANTTFYWPELEGFSVKVSSLSGRVGGSLDLRQEDKEEYEYRGGGCDIKVSTVSGNVNFEKNTSVGMGV